ncbi:MAG: 4Fe-4S binding protein [Candidatus Poribacteria bacterium]
MIIRRIRQIVQLLFLLLFLFLLLETIYPLESILPPDTFLRFDPLAALGTSLSARGIALGLILPALALAILTLFLGRFFCNWVCPLGTTLDITDRVFFKKIARWKLRQFPSHLRNLKYYILTAFCISAILGLQLIWLLDPLSIVTRSYALPLFSYSNFIADSSFDSFSRVKGVNAVSESIYPFFEKYLTSPEKPVWRMHLPFFAVFVGIVFLGIYSRRFWCRSLCPLGALLGFFSRFRILRRVVSDECIECGRCLRECKMQAISDDMRGTIEQECIECMGCVEICPTYTVSFKFRFPSFDKKSRLKAEQLDLSRRSLIKATVAGVAAAPLLSLNYGRRNINESIIRPPGALVEEEFVDRCIRCGECMKICPTNGLQPTFLEAGLQGIWTPILVPRVGYCEYVCNACTQTCPTDAIVPLTEEEKKRIKIGTAYIDRSRCIPWSEYQNCLVCEEVCPIPTKAVKFKVVTHKMYNGDLRRLKLPIVLKDKCIGCGICENKCPVTPKAAIKVTCRAEGRKTHGGLIKANETSRMEQPSRESIDVPTEGKEGFLDEGDEL